MFCENCGAKLDDGSAFCTECGYKVLEDTTEAAVNEVTFNEAAVNEDVIDEATVDAAAFVMEGLQEPVKKKKPVAAIIGVIVAIVVIGVIAVCVLGGGSKAKLEEQLLRDWERVESSGDTYYTLQLDFSETGVNYNFDSLYYDDELASFSYEIISSNEIEVQGRRIQIEFNDEKTMMTMTPALTSTDSSENWYNFD